MRLTPFLAAASALVAAALGIPLDHVQHETRHHASSMVKRATADSNLQVPARIALKQRNLDQGMHLLMDVSDPDSPRYGQHYTRDQIIDTFAPPESSAASVKKWLVEAGITAASISMPDSRGWVDFQTTVGKLESLLHTSYSVYHDPKRSNAHFIGTDSYSLPAGIADLVDFVRPAVSMTRIRRNKDIIKARDVRPRPIFKPLSDAEVRKILASQPNTTVTGCDKHVSPACIRALYAIPAAKPSPNPSNRLGLFEIDDEYFDQSDLDIFYSKVYPAIPQGTGPKVDLLNWGDTRPDPSGAVGEVALDLDMIYPIIYPQKIELFQSRTPGGPGFVDQFLDAIDGSFCTKDGGDQPIDGDTPNEMCGTFKPVPVYSFSYGDIEHEYDVKYLKRQCDEFMKLGLQGSTMVWASGDGGVAGNHGDDCQGSDGSIFSAIEPAACPYVTSVGATVVKPGLSVPAQDAEIVVDENFSPGGGFSNMFVAPAYQKSAVEAFFAQSDPGFPSYNTSNQPKVSPSGRGGGGGGGGKGQVGQRPNHGIYNRAGRGFPDMAANGLNGVVAFEGRIGTSGGTSQSAPIVAAIFTRLNEERLAAGKPLIGFANPALYKNPAMFHDITQGGMSKDEAGACGGKSWDAAKGWDPVTGLGTPNYPAMSKYFGSL